MRAHSQRYTAIAAWQAYEKLDPHIFQKLLRCEFLDVEIAVQTRIGTSRFMDSGDFQVSKDAHVFSLK